MYVLSFIGGCVAGCIGAVVILVWLTHIANEFNSRKNRNN